MLGGERFFIRTCLAVEAKPITLVAVRFIRRARPDITIARFGHRLNAIRSGAQLLAQRANDRIDNIAADKSSPPDALNKNLAAHDCRRPVDQFGENLCFQRREFDRAPSTTISRRSRAKSSLSPSAIPCVPASTKAETHSIMSPPGTSSTIVSGSAVSRVPRIEIQAGIAAPGPPHMRGNRSAPSAGAQCSGASSRGCRRYDQPDGIHWPSPTSGG